MKRRDLILTGAGGGLALLLSQAIQIQPKQEKKKANGLLIGGYYNGPDFKMDIENRTSEDVDAQIKFLKLESPGVTTLYVDFAAHSICQNPVEKNMMASISKWGLRGGIFDVRSNQFTHQLRSPENTRFFGHALFSADGKYLFASAAQNKTHIGYILVIEPETGNVVDAISSGGLAPHDFFFVDQDHIIIANSGYSVQDPSGSGNLALVNLKEKKVIAQYEAPYAAHLAQLSPNDIAVGTILPSSSNGDLFCVNTQTKSFHSFSKSSSYKTEFDLGEKLSLVVAGTNVVATTTAKGRMLILWNQQTNEITSKTFDRGVKGLVIQDNQLFISNDKGFVYSIEIQNDGRSFGQEKIIAQNFSTSSHMRLFES